MNKTVVTISGRDLSPATRLLEALTKAGLLSQDVVWTENPNSLSLYIKDESGEKEAIFQKNRFQTRRENFPA